MLSAAGCDPCAQHNENLPATLPTIVVVDAVSNQSICDAEVTAHCVVYDASFVLQTIAAAPGCNYQVFSYYLDGGLAGYGPLYGYQCTVTASKAGYQSASVSGVSPQGGGCVTAPSQVITLRLQPN